MLLLPQGHMPTHQLLRKYDLMQFSDVTKAVRLACSSLDRKQHKVNCGFYRCLFLVSSEGNLLLLNEALTKHETFFIRCGIFLILEKLKIITYRNLFKKVWVKFLSCVLCWPLNLYRSRQWSALSRHFIVACVFVFASLPVPFQVPAAENPSVAFGCLSGGADDDAGGRRGYWWGAVHSGQSHLHGEGAHTHAHRYLYQSRLTRVFSLSPRVTSRVTSPTSTRNLWLANRTHSLHSPLCLRRHYPQPYPIITPFVLQYFLNTIFVL